MPNPQSKNICIHGHFYQPPRENPWLNKVEVQDSAYPYHDWNHRINAECYARNAASRILNDEGKVVDIMNNYAWMSFNIGPTLLGWMEHEAPDTYAAILQADKDSQENFSGHGSALAQVYNHVIMPLSNRRDKETQVQWGIEDFRSRFGRHPEGMWLAETAVDTETLEVLAEHDIRFTILSPYQAKAFRKVGDKEWKDGTDAKINPRHAYRCNLPSGKTITLFFYDGPASQGVAFEGLLNNGEEFAKRLLGQLKTHDNPQLVHIATDGESYGHHHNLGEMALSYCLHSLLEKDEVKLTIYGEYLDHFEPEYEAQIAEDTSWSCAHGVERWKSNCGCSTGSEKGWTQEWRGPLRKAFDWARDEFISLYEQEMEPFTDDPWKVRNEYIQVVLDRSRGNVGEFLSNHFGNDLKHEDRVMLLKLLEMQYHCMLMYTSCGWFFDEVTGIESMQDIGYAARAVQLAEEVSGNCYEPHFVELLEQVPSNMAEFKSAAGAYEKYVKPMIVDLLRVGAHFAVASIFEEFPEEMVLYSFTSASRSQHFYEAGRQKLVVGRTHLTSNITWEESDISYSILHLGEHHLFGGVRPYISDEALEKLHSSIADAFQKSRIYEIFHLMDEYFGSHSYSFWHLFRDEQHAIMEQVTENTLEKTEGTIDQLYLNSYPVLQVFREINMKVPKQLKLPVDLALNTRLTKLLKEDEIDLQEVKKLLEAAQHISADLDLVTLQFLVNERVTEQVEKLATEPSNKELLQYTVDFLKLMKQAGLKSDFWKAQNMAFLIKTDHFETYDARCEEGDEEAKSWCQLFGEFYLCLNLVL